MDFLGDRTFYLLSYTLFCLAILVPIGWFLFKATRGPKE